MLEDDIELARKLAERLDVGALASEPTDDPELQSLLQTHVRLRQLEREPDPAFYQRLRCSFAQPRAWGWLAPARQLVRRYTSRQKRARQWSGTWQRALLAVLLVVALTGVVADTASAGSLPGDPFYQWKRTKEDISLTLTTDPRQRSRLHVDYARRRVEELNALVTRDDVSDASVIGDTLNNLLAHTQGAIDEAQQGQNIAEIKPALYRLLDQAEAMLAQAAAADPQAMYMFIDALTELKTTARQLPSSPASNPTSVPVRIVSPTSTNRLIIKMVTPTREPAVQPTVAPTAAPTISVPPTALPPTAARPIATWARAVPPAAVPTDSSAIEVWPTMTPVPTEPPATEAPTALPATEAPPTVPPATEAPPDKPRHPPVALPTNTPPPTSTPIPTATDGPSQTLPPTPPSRPSRTPQPTPTDTPPPTNTPTDIPTATATVFPLAPGLPPLSHLPRTPP